MKFMIVENQGGELDSLRYLLDKCYPQYEIVPDKGKTIKNWPDAEALIRRKAANDAEQIIFLDLALDNDASDAASAGLERVTNLFTHCPEAIWIAYTSFSDILAGNVAKAHFHGILYKQQLNLKRDEEEKKGLIRSVIDEAVRRRRGTVTTRLIEHEDSAGMRSFFAIYPNYVLEWLTTDECTGWSDYSVRALSSGYSGSSLLQIVGKKDSAPRQIVVKLAPRREILEPETSVISQYVGEGGVYVGRFCQPSSLRDLPNQAGFYSIQESVQGRTLMSILEDKAISQRPVEKALGAIINISIEQYKTKWQTKENDEEKKLSRFKFGQIDRDRAQQACSFLLDIGQGLSSRGQWPGIAPKVDVLFGAIEQVLSNWETRLRETQLFWWVLQHGDLNPHNVMIGTADQITFIDLARLGHWPVGYDLSRLAIQLRMRLIDQGGSLDWFGDRLADWCAEQIWNPGNVASVDYLCPAAGLCERAFSEFVRTRDETERTSLITGSGVGALFDLIRILSYNDLSPFKRLWAAIGCFEQADNLGWLS